MFSKQKKLIDFSVSYIFFLSLFLSIYLSIYRNVFVCLCIYLYVCECAYFRVFEKCIHNFGSDYLHYYRCLIFTFSNIGNENVNPSSHVPRRFLRIFGICFLQGSIQFSADFVDDLGLSDKRVMTRSRSCLWTSWSVSITLNLYLILSYYYLINHLTGGKGCCLLLSMHLNYVMKFSVTLSLCTKPKNIKGKCTGA